MQISFSFSFDTVALLIVKYYIFCCLADSNQCDQIFCTLCNFNKPLATINLPKYPTFLGNFCKGVKIYHFSSEIIFGQLL